MSASELIEQSKAPYTAIAQNELLALAGCADWQSKYRIIMNLGKQLPTFSTALQSDELLIDGCDSKAWLLHYYQVTEQKHYWAFDSEARVVKGLVALALCQINGKTQTELKQLDVKNLLGPLGLTQNISPSRQNGLQAVLHKITGQILLAH